MCHSDAMRRYITLALVLSLLPAMAAAWAMREGDEPLSEAALRAALVGQVLITEAGDRFPVRP